MIDPWRDRLDPETEVLLAILHELRLMHETMRAALATRVRSTREDLG